MGAGFGIGKGGGRGEGSLGRYTNKYIRAVARHMKGQREGW